MRDHVNFSFMDKYQSFLEGGTIPYGGRGQKCPKYQK